MEDDPQGCTWGQMAPIKQRDMFGLSRMDKLLYCGAVKCTEFTRFGLGVEVEDQNIRDMLIKDEGMEHGYVTDHLGVKADFEVLVQGSPNSKI
jgi:tyrosyl-DNA phosphodiesterase 2